MVILKIYRTFLVTRCEAETFSKLSIIKTNLKGPCWEEDLLNYLSVSSAENITKLLFYEEVIKDHAAKSVGKKLINTNKN